MTDDELCQIEATLTDWFHPDCGNGTVARLLAEVRRLKAGDFTEEEFQNLCHKFSPDDACRFGGGCFEYNRKLFGENSVVALILPNDHADDALVDCSKCKGKGGWWRCSNCHGEWAGDVGPDCFVCFHPKLDRVSCPTCGGTGRIPTVPRPHDLYDTGDPDAPDSIKDGNGEVVLGLCRRCGKGECELSEGCM